MNELLTSWTLTWFALLNVGILLLAVIYYLFEKRQRGEE